MATNQVFGPEANHAIEVNAGSSVSQGDVVQVGSLVGVAQDDSDSNNHVTIMTAGAFNLSVNANDTGGTGTNVNNGDALYFDGTDIRPDSSHGSQIGFAYDPDETDGTTLVSSGNTGTIWVILDR